VSPSASPDRDLVTRCAVVGLGNMGGAVAARLHACGFDVIGVDLDERARSRVGSSGIPATATIAEGIAAATVVLTSLPADAAVLDAWTGPGGIAAVAAPGTFVVELSTIGPDTMREVAAVARRSGLRPVDAPVSGGPAEAAAGTLALIVGGEDTDLDEVDHVLAALGPRRRTGPIGSAKVVKLVNNMMTMGNVAVAAEAFAVGLAAGVDATALYDVLAESGGRSHHFTKRFPKALADDFAPGFTVRLGEKDLRLALALAESVGVPTPAAATGTELYGSAITEGLGDLDIVAMLELYRRWSNQR